MKTKNIFKKIGSGLLVMMMVLVFVSVVSADNCCDYNPPQGCVSGPGVTHHACFNLGGAGFFPNHVCGGGR